MEGALLGGGRCPQPSLLTVLAEVSPFPQPLARSEAREISQPSSVASKGLGQVPVKVRDQGFPPPRKIWPMGLQPTFCGAKASRSVLGAAVEATSSWHPRLLPWFTCFTHQVATEDFAWMENSQLEYMKKIIALAPLYRLGNRGAETPPSRCTGANGSTESQWQSSG